MIPKIIWQTHAPEFNQLPKNIVQYVNTWKNLNPEYEYRYMSDTQCLEFVKNYFDKDIYQTFKSVPVPVMKADLWRLLVTYRFGGVYSDLDTICLKPIKTWMLENKSFIVGREHADTLSPATFAAAKGSKILEYVIGEIIKNLKNINFKDSFIVHRYTGAWAFTRYIFDFLKIQPKNIIEEAEQITNSQSSIENGFYLFYNDKVNMFLDTAVEHRHGVASLNELGYEYWAYHALCINDMTSPEVYTKIHEDNKKWRGW